LVTGKDIEEGLRDLGLKSGDIVLVHSSLSSFGRVEGGADAVVDAILSVLGHEGTLVVPTFNYAPDPFDPELTPSLLGVITETVRKRPEARRSLHPTHSVAAIGPHTEAIVSWHENTNSFGEGSALRKLLEMNGKVMLIGVTHTTSSMIHVAEEIVGVPYLNRVRQVTVATPHGKVAKVLRRPGCSRGFDKITERLEATGTVRKRLIGKSLVQLMPASAIVSAAAQMLKEDPASLLCDLPDCEVCAQSRAMISATESQARDEAMARFLAEPRGEGIKPLERGEDDVKDRN